MDSDLKYHIINSLIAGALVFLGSFTGSSFKLTWGGLAFGLATAGVVALTKFQSWYNSKDPNAQPTDPAMNKKGLLRLFSFVGGI